MSYEPQVNDYVKWDRSHYPVKGWVYFKCSDYITIEIGTRDKTQEQIVNGTHHRKEHILVLCFTQNWNQLEYVKSRSPHEH